jgi:outer membrane cobalamin receptor
LVLASAALASAADGLVLDPSGRPIAKARVECAGRLAETGPDGRFTLAGVEPCTATVSAPGFRTARVALAAPEAARIELAIAPRAERVVVSATRRETSIEETGAAATVITGADLEARQTASLADVLREVPGLQVARYGRPGSLTQVFARGSQRTGTLVLVDGVPVNDPGGELNLAGFSTSGIERIEVVRGPESALFGAEAASGVIQLFTQRGSPEYRLPRGSLTYERGSFQTDRWTARLTGGAGPRLDYSLSAEQYHTAGQYVNDYFRNTTGTANVGFRISDATQVRAVYRTFDSAAGTPNQVGYGLYDLDANEATRDSLVSVRLEDIRGPHFAQHASFGYHRSHDLFLDPAGESYDVAALVRDVATPVPRVYFAGLADPAAPVPPGLRLVTQSVYLWPSDPYLSLSSRKNFEYQGTLAHAGGAAVFGYQYERQDADVTGRQVDRDNHAGFLHVQQTLAGRLFLSAGARLERNSAFGAKWTPRGAASYRLSGQHGALSATYVRASAGIGITDPSLLQNFARDPYFVGNPALKPERTTSYEAGIIQEWWGRRLRIEAAAFDSSFKDLIAFVFPPFPQVATWQNIEASRARGLEFSAQGRITALVSVAGAYTRMWTRVTRSNSPNTLYASVGQELPRRPGNLAALSLSLTPRRWMLQAGATLVGERQDTNLFGVTRNPGYQNVWVSGSLRLAKGLAPFVRAENVLNRYYEEVLGYPAARRSVHGGLRIEW